jgi:peptidoglycan hydrolase-like protein with peptidoglycan-binding domain
MNEEEKALFDKITGSSWNILSILASAKPDVLEPFIKNHGDALINATMGRGKWGDFSPSVQSTIAVFVAEYEAMKDMDPSEIHAHVDHYYDKMKEALKSHGHPYANDHAFAHRALAKAAIQEWKSDISWGKFFSSSLDEEIKDTAKEESSPELINKAKDDVKNQIKAKKEKKKQGEEADKTRIAGFLKAFNEVDSEIGPIIHEDGHLNIKNFSEAIRRAEPETSTQQIDWHFANHGTLSQALKIYYNEKAIGTDYDTARSTLRDDFFFTYRGTRAPADTDVDISKGDRIPANDGTMKIKHYEEFLQIGELISSGKITSFGDIMHHTPNGTLAESYSILRKIGDTDYDINRIEGSYVHEQAMLYTAETNNFIARSMRLDKLQDDKLEFNVLTAIDSWREVPFSKMPNELKHLINLAATTQEEDAIEQAYNTYKKAVEEEKTKPEGFIEKEQVEEPGPTNLIKLDALQKYIADGTHKSTDGSTDIDGGRLWRGCHVVNSNAEDAIRELQTTLGVTSDGKFGSKTEEALKALQQKYGIGADGIVGPRAMVALEIEQALLKAKGNDATALQDELSDIAPAIKNLTDLNQNIPEDVFNTLQGKVKDLLKDLEGGQHANDISSQTIKDIRNAAGLSK